WPAPSSGCRRSASRSTTRAGATRRAAAPHGKGTGSLGATTAPGPLRRPSARSSWFCPLRLGAVSDLEVTVVAVHQPVPLPPELAGGKFVGRLRDLLVHTRD